MRQIQSCIPLMAILFRQGRQLGNCHRFLGTGVMQGCSVLTFVDTVCSAGSQERTGATAGCSVLTLFDTVSSTGSERRRLPCPLQKYEQSAGLMNEASAYYSRHYVCQYASRLCRGGESNIRRGGVEVKSIVGGEHLGKWGEDGKWLL